MATKGLRLALDRITEIQKAISIDDPMRVDIQAAYKLVPPASVQLPDLPCFLNTWTLVGMETNPEMRTLRYQVSMQCVVARATVEDDISADIATALFEQALDDFGHDIALAGTVTIAIMRGGDPTLVIIERGQAYIGWQAILDIQITTAFTST